MLKTSFSILFLSLLFPFYTEAQSSSYFDGEDDRATVYHHSDFNIGFQNFTIEAVVKGIPMDKSMMTLISKRNNNTNGFAIIINTQNSIDLIAQIGKNRYKIDASALVDGHCHSIALRREEEKITLFIDNKDYYLGTNAQDINTKENLIIGDDGAKTNKTFQGSIEEIRFWKEARSNQDIFDWNTRCISPATNGLLAYWNMNEGKGQFFHDVTQAKHHAYLGNNFNPDAQDPEWNLSKCLESCCHNNTSFLVAPDLPFAAQWVDFTNTSSTATSYEWSINGHPISNSQHFQYSFGIGTFIVTLKTINKDGCVAYYSKAIEINNTNFSYCGNESILSPEVQALEEFENTLPIPNPLPILKMYDRFGNRYLPNQITIPPPLKSAGSTPNSCSCGIFELYFEDMIHNRDYGFDDPALGADRRAVACKVFEDLSQLINPTGSLTSNLVKIQVKKSEGKGPLEATPIDELASGILAVAGPYMITSYNNGIIDGLVYKTITSGTNALANTPGWNPNSYHGSVRVDFELPNFFLNNTNWTAITPNNQIDLYSTLLHESLHILGFYSLIDVNTNLSKINGTQLYNKYDTYLENSAGTPYIDPTTGILNPTSTFIGGTGCSADVVFNSTTNPNQDVYLPSPWNFSILSHFNCNNSSGQSCANNNGYIMNACLAPGEMQRSPNQQEYNTLCDIGYKLSTNYGFSTIGPPAHNVPYQLYANCSSPCPVSGVDDNLTNTIIVAAGATITINASDFLTNDNNPSGSYQFNALLTSFGTITNATAAGFDFTADPTFGGTAIIQYTPTCSNGNIGSHALIFIQVTPPPFPACDLPSSSCNLLCFGDFENIIGDATGHTVGLFDDFITTYENGGTPFFGSASLVATTELIRFNTTTSTPNWTFLNQNLYGCTGHYTGIPSLPLPINFPTNNSYIGMTSRSSTIQNYDHIYLPLASPLDPSTTGTNNYRLTFWAFTPCIDVDLRMILSDAPPCINGVNNLYDPTSTSYLPSPNPSCWFNFNGLNTTCPTYSATLNEGITISNPPNATGAYSWKQYTLDFHVNSSNIQHVIFHPAFGSGFSPPGTSTPCYPKYLLLDEMTIEKIVQPQLTVSSTVIGTPCPGNKVIIEYNICSDAPVSGLDLDVQLPGGGLSYTNTHDFINGKIIGLDLGINGNPLCTLLQVEIEVPIGAITPNTQSIAMDILSNSACTNSTSSLTTDIDIVEGSTMSISIVPSISPSVSVGNSFTVDITIQNNGSYDIQNVVVDLLSGSHITGLSHNFTATNVGTIVANSQHTISNIPIQVLGPCGIAQICAQVVSADGSCNLPNACSTPINIIGNNAISFPIEAEDATHTNNTIFTATAISNNNDIYSVGLFSNDISFTEGTNTNTLTKSHTCASLFSPFLVKYNPCGFEWAIEIPVCNLVNLKTGPDVEVGQHGNIYVSFSFLGSFNINGITYTSQGGADIAIIKYSPTGSPIWVQIEGGSGDDLVTDIETYYNGTNEEIFIIGTLNGFATNSVIFATTPSTIINYANFGNFCNSCSSSGGITYIISYIDNGTSASIKWVNSLSNAATLSGKLATDILGNIYAIGNTNTSFIFNGITIGSTSTSLNDGAPSAANDDIDIFILKYDNNGNEIWAELYGSRRPDIGYLEGSIFEFDIECEGSTHIGILLPSSALPLVAMSQPYMHNWGTHILRLNAIDGSLNWVQPIALAATSLNNHIIGNLTYHCNLTISTTNYLVNGSFLLRNPFAQSPIGFPTINFHGTTIDYTDMNSYPTYDEYQGAFTANFDNGGSLQWVNINTSITPHTPALDIHSSLTNLGIETDQTGNIYAPFYLRGTTSIATNNLTGGINGNPNMADGFIAKINPTTGAYLRPTLMNSNSLNTDVALELSNNLLSINRTYNKNLSTKLYPNPSTGKVSIELQSSLPSNTIEQISLYDITGKKLKNFELENPHSNKFELDLPPQQTGVYMIEMIINQQLIRKPIVLIK